MERFEEAGVTVIALSYDEPDALTAFAEWAGITFPLLSSGWRPMLLRAPVHH